MTTDHTDDDYAALTTGYAQAIDHDTFIPESSWRSWYIGRYTREEILHGSGGVRHWSMRDLLANYGMTCATIAKPNDDIEKAQAQEAKLYLWVEITRRHALLAL